MAPMESVTQQGGSWGTPAIAGSVILQHLQSQFTLLLPQGGVQSVSVTTKSSASYNQPWFGPLTSDPSGVSSYLKVR